MGAEPACGHLGDVEQAVAADADEFGSVPCEEVSRWLTDACGMGEFAEADGAALALVAEGPSETEEADGECGDELDVVGGVLRDGRTEVREVDGHEVDDGEKENEFGGEEGPAMEAGGP